MEHIAIDLGGRESQICVRAADGVVVDEKKWFTRNLRRYLQGRAPSKVIVETCSEGFWVADVALELGHQPIVVPATLAKTLGVGARGIKTDQRDAQALSLASCRLELPSVHIPSAYSREVKSLAGMREALTQVRTKLINTVRGWLRSHAVRIHSGATTSFPARVRAALADRDSELPGYVIRQLEAIDGITDQIRDANQDVKRLANENAVCRRLMTIPGVGPVTALRFVATLDRVERFSSASAVYSYLGLTPGENSSSERKRRTSITKAGSPTLRWSLVQAAWCAYRMRGRQLHPMLQWASGIEERRGRNIAVVALARKLAGMMYAIWRDGTTYDPLHSRGAPEE